MINIQDDIQPLTTFRNNSVKMMRQLRKTGRPIVLMVNGKSEAVVQSAEAYQPYWILRPWRMRQRAYGKHARTCR